MPTPHDGMTLVFSDTFTYSGSPPVDPTKWFIGDPRPGNVGFSNAKFLLAGDPNIDLVFTGGGGTPLSINACYNTAFGTAYGTPWISGLISSAWESGGKIAGVGVRQGYFEVVMTVPVDPNAQGVSGGTGSGSGTWAGFWLEQFPTILGTGPTMEIDTELYGVGNNQFPATSQWWPLTGPTNHTYWQQQVGNTSGFPTIPVFQGVSTTFGMLIDEFNVTWFVDGVQQCVIPLVIPTSVDPFFLMIDLGMGGGWPIVPPTAPATSYPLIVTSAKIWEAPNVPTITGVTSATVTPTSATTFEITYMTGAPPPPPPTFSPAASPSTSGGPVTIGTVAPGTTGDTLTVTLSDPTFPTGSSLAISGGNLVYTPGTITSGNAGTDTLAFTLNESNGASAGFTKAVTLTFSGGGTGGNGLVVANFTSRTTQLSHFNAAVAAVKAGTAGARCVVVCTGDSITGGVTQASSQPSAGTPFPDQLAIALGGIEGVHYNYSSFYGDQQAFQYITFTGSANWNFGLGGPGSGSLNFNAVNDAAVWAPTDSRLMGTFDHVDVTYYDAGGPGTMEVIIGSSTYSFAFGSTSDVKTISIPITAVTNPASVTFKMTAGSYGFVTGCALWSHAMPSIEVRNVGVGGSTMQQMSPATLTGINQVFGIMTLDPHLVIIEFGGNDVRFSGNSGAETLAQLESNLAGAIATFLAPGTGYTPTDVLVMTQTPFTYAGPPTPTYTFPQVIAAEQGVATSAGVPIADLRATYGNADAAYEALAGGDHPTAAGYVDIGKRIASFLTNTAGTYANFGLPAPVTGSGWVLD